MDKMDEGLKTLLDLGKRRGFLTFDQVNDFLPDEASSPEKISGLLESLDELGIELINEDEAESRLAASGDIDDTERPSANPSSSSSSSSWSRAPASVSSAGASLKKRSATASSKIGEALDIR